MESPNGQYAFDRPWQLTAEWIMTARMENYGPNWTPPFTPVLNAYEMIPPRYGYRTTELGIDDILNETYSKLDSGGHARDSSMTDWSGQTGGYSAIMRPTGAGGSGIT